MAYLIFLADFGSKTKVSLAQKAMKRLGKAIQAIRTKLVIIE